MAFALFCNTCRGVSELGVGEPPAPILIDELQALTTSKAAASARPKKIEPLNVFISNSFMYARRKLDLVIHYYYVVHVIT